MDIDAFYSVVSGINFTLLGLWWVAIKDRADIGGDNTAGRRMAYIVSLQFLIPGTVSLLSQVAPDKPLIWRLSFTIAGLAGAARDPAAHTLVRAGHRPGERRARCCAGRWCRCIC